MSSVEAVAVLLSSGLGKLLAALLSGKKQLGATTAKDQKAKKAREPHRSSDDVSFQDGSMFIVVGSPKEKLPNQTNKH